jgi:microcystin-dependent protein
LDHQSKIITSMKKLILIPMLLCAVATTGFGQSTLIPQVMAFQGYVTTDTGAFSGITPVTLTLYDDSASNNQVWSQSWTIADSVQVRQGYYSVVMDLSYPGNWQHGYSGFTKQFWLDANVQGKDLSPRVRLTASPYSFHAQLADSATKVPSSVPIGTIEAYGLDISKLPNDSIWLPCDGREIWKGAWPEFYALAGSTYGRAGTDSVYLPDFRCLFLRGVDGGMTGMRDGNDTLRDPDAGIRGMMRDGANGGNNVGSIQGDAVGPHTHEFSLNMRAGSDALNGSDPATVKDPAQGSNSANVPGPQSYVTSNGIATGTVGQESRPKNAYVYWIIKVK